MKPDYSAIDRIREAHFHAEMRRKFYVELSKAGFEEDELRVIYDIVCKTCMRCLDADKHCDCRRDFY